MNPRLVFVVTLFCIVSSSFISRVAAHIDEVVQVMRPDPVVKTFEAENLPAIGELNSASDALARGGAAVSISKVGDGFELDLGELPIGIYSVWVAAKVTDENAVEDSINLKRLAADTQQTKPLYLELHVNSANDGSVQEHRMRVPFSKVPQFEYISKMYFHAPQQRHYKAKLMLSRGSLVKSVSVDYIDLRNPLGLLSFKAIKTKRILVQDKDIPTMAASAAKEGKLPSPIRKQPLTREKRMALDDLIWSNSIMPIDANPGQIYGAVNRAPDELPELLQGEEARQGVKLGQWTTPRSSSYEEPWVIENKVLEKTYTRADYDAGKTLPAPWPFPEDKGAYYFEKEKWGLSAPFNYGIIPAAIQARYHVVLGALGATPQSNIQANRFDLPSRYLLLGDLEAAADASFLLAAYAYHYPAYDWNNHCIINIVNVNRTFIPGSVNGRGCSYEGWSTDEVAGVLRAYDYLFPYIDGNQDLADRLGRFIPWIKTPDDVVKMIDTFLVQRAARDGLDMVLYSPIVPTAAIVLGPCDVADDYLDRYVFKSEVYLRESRSAFVDGIVNNYSRDGMNYIGSTYYVVGESIGEMMDRTMILDRYVAAGGNRRFNISDPKRFPRLAALPDGLLGLHTAGGHRIGVGDVHDPQAPFRPWLHVLKDEALDVFEKGWQWTKDPKFAWVLANRRGQGDMSDKAWAAVLEAAKQMRDPLTHTESRVLEGFGVARLEENVDATDMRMKQSAVLRFGVASGHAHPDTLDLEVYAYGTRATSDLGGRLSGQYGRPSCMSTFVHNLVQVDDDDFNDGPQNSTAQGWLTAFKPMPGAQYVAGSARADAQPQVTDYRRGVLQVMVDPGDNDHPARGYLFDVFRVAGGKTHTWCFHGSVSDDFVSNASLEPATSEQTIGYLKRHHNDAPKLEGRTPDVLEATWRLRRAEEQIGKVKLKGAEQEIMQSFYDESSPRKFTRVRLFGHGGDKTMVGNWYCDTKRQRSFPFLYIRNESDTELSSVYPALIEPYAGDPIIVDAKQFQTTDGAVGLAVLTAQGQHDILYSSPTREMNQIIPGGAVSGDVALVSRDGEGLRLLTLVGGTMLEQDDVKVSVSQPEYRAKIESLTAGMSRVRVNQELPQTLLDGQVMTVGNNERHASFTVEKAAGKQVDFRRTTRSYRGAAMYIDPKGEFIQLDATPSLASYHPSYYNGMTAVNEAGKVVGRVRVELGDRLWFTGWPDVRKHLERIDESDLTDENGDGKVTLGMYVNPDGPDAIRFAEDGETIVTLKGGEKMLDIEVSRVAENGYMLYTKQHPREYLDALKVPHPGWPYNQQIVRNERGDKQWIVNMPGDTYRLRFEGKTISAADFPDTDGDGRAVVELHEMGPGDEVSAPTHVYLRRMSDGAFELRADVGCSVTIRGQTFAFDEAVLASGPQIIRLK